MLNIVEKKKKQEPPLSGDETRKGFKIRSRIFPKLQVSSE